MEGHGQEPLLWWPQNPVQTRVTVMLWRTAGACGWPELSEENSFTRWHTSTCACLFCCVQLFLSLFLSTVWEQKQLLVLNVSFSKKHPLKHCLMKLEERRASSSNPRLPHEHALGSALAPSTRQHWATHDSENCTWLLYRQSDVSALTAYKSVDSSDLPEEHCFSEVGTSQAHLKYLLLLLILLFLNKLPALNLTVTGDGGRHHTLCRDQKNVAKLIPRLRKNVQKNTFKSHGNIFIYANNDTLEKILKIMN